jgi:cell division protein FtsI/penicillin-binding protein 2
MSGVLQKAWVRALAIVVFVAAGLYAFSGMASGLLRELAQSRSWIKQPDFTEASKESEDLFRELVRDGIIWIDTSLPALRNQPCEAIFDPSLAIQRTGAPPLRRKQLERMCNQPAGKQILEEVLVWNSSFLIAAVRDDRNTSTRCADGAVLDLPVVPPGCRPAPWAANILQQGGSPSPLSQIPNAVPPPRDFADFAAGSARSLSDWALFGPLRDEADRLSLTTRLPAGNRRVLVEAIVTPSRITVGGEGVNIDPKRDTLSVRAGGLVISGARVCDDDEFENCAEAQAKGMPQGWRLTVTGPRRRDVDVTIEGTPVRAVPPGAKEILSGEGGATGKVRLWRSAQIEANCDRQSRTNLDCQLSWRTTVTQQRRSGGVGRRVAFADGTVAIEPNGKPGARVDELGLTALIGYGPSDIGSLTSAIGNARTRDPLVLTIEPELQKLAQDAIYAKMGDRLGRSSKRLRINPNVNPDNEPPDQGDARVAVVMMDAGDNPGEVLAMASWPDFRPGMHSWDILALSSGREGDSPLAGHPWRAGDVHAMPGSTFKLVAGLAGIAATKTVPWAADVVLGREAPARQMARLGIGAAALNVEGVTIGNYGGGAFAGSILPPGPGGSGCPPEQRGGQISVCEALIKSSNLWFAGLALGIDGPKTSARPPSQPSGRTGTFLAAATERLFPISQPPGTPLVPGLDRRGVDLTRGIVPGALRLYAEPVDLAVEDKRSSRRIDLATNAYGQGVRATPLAMATIYGSVGARKVISPRILKPVKDVQETIPRFEGERIIPGMTTAAEDKAYLDAVDAGLFGVVNSPYGTAGKVMAVVPPDIRRRIYAKTGTADTAPGYNSAWLAGWINDAAGRRRIAFTCWVTHTQLTGGGACGALMAPMLAKIGAMKGRS